MMNAYSTSGLRLAKLAVSKQEINKGYNKQEVIKNMMKLGLTENEALKIWFDKYGNAENVLAK